MSRSIQPRLQKTQCCVRPNKDVAIFFKSRHDTFKHVCRFYVTLLFRPIARRNADDMVTEKRRDAKTLFILPNIVRTRQFYFTLFSQPVASRNANKNVIEKETTRRNYSLFRIVVTHGRKRSLQESIAFLANVFINRYFKSRTKKP